MFIVAVTCRWSVTFQASRVGNRCLRGRTRGSTAFCGPRSGKMPSAGIAMGGSDDGPRVRPEQYAVGVGPHPRVKTALRSFVPPLTLESERSWLARTVSFCVTTWPKFEPNTLMSQLQP